MFKFFKPTRTYYTIVQAHTLAKAHNQFNGTKSHELLNPVNSNAYHKCFNNHRAQITHIKYSEPSSSDQPDVHFGCFGNPMNRKCNCDTDGSNYKKYLYHEQNFHKLDLCKSPSDIKGYWNFTKI
jgi:hypothetical protein